MSLARAWNFVFLRFSLLALKYKLIFDFSLLQLLNELSSLRLVNFLNWFITLNLLVADKLYLSEFDLLRRRSICGGVRDALARQWLWFTFWLLFDDYWLLSDFVRLFCHIWLSLLLPCVSRGSIFNLGRGHSILMVTYNEVLLCYALVFRASRVIWCYVSVSLLVHWHWWSSFSVQVWLLSFLGGNSDNFVAQTWSCCLLVPSLRRILYLILLLLSLRRWTICLNEVIMLCLALGWVASQRSLLAVGLMRWPWIDTLHGLWLVLIQNLVHCLLNCFSAFAVEPVLCCLGSDARTFHCFESLRLRLLV